MFLARVTGSVIATIKNPRLGGYKILHVQPVGLGGEDAGTGCLALDRIQAGVGDLVLVNREGNTVRQLFEDERIPVHTIVVGIVDRVDMEKES